MNYHKIHYTLLLIGALCGSDRGQAQDVLVTGLEQLSALQGYIHSAEEGYQIVTDGLRLIGDIKGGELTLHRVYFGSLREVDEAVLQDPALQDAYAEVAATNRLLEEAWRSYAASGWLGGQEVQYLAAVQQQVAGDGQANIAALRMLVREGALSLTDGERLQRIRDQQAEIRVRYVRVTMYVRAIRGLVTGRAKEEAFKGTLKTWYVFK